MIGAQVFRKVDDCCKAIGQQSQTQERLWIHHSSDQDNLVIVNLVALMVVFS